MCFISVGHKGSISDDVLTVSVSSHFLPNFFKMLRTMNNISVCGARLNQSDPFHIGDRYGGIPLNLCTNLLGSCVLLILFLVIRKNAVRSVRAKLSLESLDNVNITMLLFGKQRVTKSLNEDEEQTSDLRLEQNKNSMGPDAIQYLTFQKYIIIYIAFTTFISIGILLIFDCPKILETFPKNLFLKKPEPSVVEVVDFPPFQAWCCPSISRGPNLVTPQSLVTLPWPTSVPTRQRRPCTSGYTSSSPSSCSQQPSSWWGYSQLASRWRTPTSR